MPNINGYFTVEERLQTFKKFSKIKGAPLCNPLNFAQAGFISMGSKRIKDLVKCFACGKELDSWEPGDDPWKEHIKRGADCPFVLFRSKEQQTLEDFLDLHLKVRSLQVEREIECTKTSAKAHFEKVIDSISN